MNSSLLEIDRADFVGKYLTEICLGIGSPVLNFSTPGQPGEGGTISTIAVYGKFALILDGDAYAATAPAPDLAGKISKLLNEDVTDISINTVSGIKLFFGLTRILEIPPDPAGFENASVNVRGKNPLLI